VYVCEGGMSLVAISLEKQAWQFWRIDPNNLKAPFLLPFWESGGEAKNPYVPSPATVNTGS